MRKELHVEKNNLLLVLVWLHDISIARRWCNALAWSSWTLDGYIIRM